MLYRWICLQIGIAFQTVFKLASTIMKFKTHFSPLQQPQDFHEDHHQAPPQERSSIINDPSNYLRTFIQHIRGVFIEEEEADGVILMFGIEDQTGQIRISITRQPIKKQESNLSRYRHLMTHGIQNYQQVQLELTRGLARSLETARKGRIYYQFCKRSIEQTSPFQLLNTNLMELIESPRLGKQRSCSRDTTETLEQYEPFSALPQARRLSLEQRIAMSLLQVD